MLKMITKKLGKPCHKCGQRFIPSTRFCTLCFLCLKLSKENRMLKNRIIYNE